MFRRWAPLSQGVSAAKARRFVDSRTDEQGRSSGLRRSECRKIHAIIACHGQFPLDGLLEEKAFFMWCAAGYFDESDDNERAYAVAGFMGHQLDCVHLDWAWKERLLDKYKLDYFKASELNSGTGQFAKYRDNPDKLHTLFSERERNLFRQIKIESVDIFLEFDLLISFGAVLILPDYRRLLKEYRVAGKTLPAPYFLCAQLVMMELGFVMAALNNGPKSQQGCVRPNFDSHDEYARKTKRMFDDFALKNPVSSKSLLPPHYVDDKEYLVLQAADNLAYEMRRLLITSEYDKHIPEREAMTRLKKRVLRIYKLNYEAMKMIMESQKPNLIPIEPEITNTLTDIRE
jgi:Protein of unknown function (DUF3800)